MSPDIYSAVKIYFILKKVLLLLKRMEEIILSAAVGVIIGVMAIAAPTMVPKFDHGKKNDDAANEGRKGNLKLSADKVMKKAKQYPEFQRTLGLTEDDIRRAVDDVNISQSKKDEISMEDLEPINWVKILEWLILLGAGTCVLWFVNVQTKGEVVHWMCTYFPKEMSTLGFESTYVRPTSTIPNMRVPMEER